MNKVEQIIQAVHEREILWNISHKNYKNIKLKAQQWKSISEELKLPVDVVKKKWRCLRDTYARNLSRQRVTGKRADDFEPPGLYSAQMVFLKDHLKPRAAIGNYVQSAEEGSPTNILPASATQDLDFSSYSAMFSDAYDPGSSMLTGSSTSLSTCGRASSSNAEMAKRRKIVPETSIIEQSCLDTETSMHELPKPLITQAIAIESPLPAPSNSEDELFFRSIVQKLSTFPIELRNSTKLEMLQYINDVQMEWLRESCVFDPKPFNSIRHGCNRC